MGVTTTFSLLASVLPEKRLEMAEAALAEPYIELQSAAFRTLAGPGGLNRPDVVTAYYSDLLPEIKQLVAKRKELFLHGIPTQIRVGDDRGRRAAYQVLADLSDEDIYPELVQGITDISARVRDTVVEILENFVLRCRYHMVDFRSRGSEESRTFLERRNATMHFVLEAMLKTYAIHNRRSFVDLAIEIGAEEYATVTNLIVNRASPLRGALQDTLLRSQHEGAVEMLLKLSLEINPLLRDLATDIFEARRDAAFGRLVAGCLERMPADRLAVLAVRSPDIPWWPAVAATPNLPPAGCVKIIEFIARCGIEPAERRFPPVLSFMIHQDPRVRARAVAALQEMGYPKALDEAVRAMDDVSDEVRLAAARAVIAIDPPQKLKLLTPLLGAGSEELRRVAMHAIVNASFARYLESFDKMDVHTRAVAARALAKIDASMLDRLAEEIGSLDPARRLKALRIVGFVGGGKEMGRTLVELLTDPDTRIRATAIKVVELTGSADGMKLLISALNDSDRRVRANAIETFEDVGDSRYLQLLLPFLNDPDNRVRANAAKALWNLGRREAREALEAMLEDPDEKMRLSAVWAFGETRCEGASTSLVTRLRKEPSERIRARITEVLSHLNTPPAKKE